jgi:DNA-binding transcriptional LysR family regulator
MDIRQLEYFVAVAVELNFSRAAERIHVVQSALSASVAKLEKELGVDLFDRTRRQISLSPAGETFLDQARQVLLAAKIAKTSMLGFQGQVAGTVAIGTLMSSGTLNLPAAIAQLRRTHPLVKVRLRQSAAGSAGHVSAVADGTLDLALISTPGKPSALVDVRPLHSEAMVFVCHPDHRFARRARVCVADLVDEQLIQFAGGWGVRRLVDQAFASAGLTAVAAYEVADYATAAGLIGHQLGTAVMPVGEATRFTGLQAIALDPALTWTLYLAAARSASRNPAAVTFADMLRHQAGQNR